MNELNLSLKQEVPIHRNKKPSTRVIQQPKSVIGRIRMELKLNQSEMSKLLEVGSNQLSLYESGRLFPCPKVAKRIQRLAKTKGIDITLDEIYKDLDDLTYVYTRNRGKA